MNVSRDEEEQARGDAQEDAEDDEYVELDYELAVALVKATEGAARSTAMKGLSLGAKSRVRGMASAG